VPAPAERKTAVAASADTVTADAASPDPARSDQVPADAASHDPAAADAIPTGKPAEKPKPGLLERMQARPVAATVILVGAICFTPGVAYLAAVQSVGGVSASWEASALALLAVVIIDLWLVWLPVLLYLAAPDRTVALVKAGNAWMRQHSRLVLAMLLGLVGVWLLVSGIAALVN
jgi:hypothetical protein